MRSLTLALAAGLLALAAGPARAAAPAPKVIILVTSDDDPGALNVALFNSQKLQQAGADVKLVFQAGGVVALAGLAGKLDETKARAIEEDEKGKNQKDRSAKYHATRKYRPAFKKSEQRFTALRQSGLAIIACGASAQAIGMRDDLVAAGINATPADEFIDLTPWIRDGYQILTF